MTALEPNSELSSERLGESDLRGFYEPDDSLYDGARELRHYLEDPAAEHAAAPDPAPEG
jgi:hypothetical protein